MIAQKQRPEPAVLTDNSLHTLAKEIDSDIRFIMLLCIPTTRIVQMKDDAGMHLLPGKVCTKTQSVQHIFVPSTYMALAHLKLEAREDNSYFSVLYLVNISPYAM